MKQKQNFCAVKWETENEDSFSFGAPTNATLDGSTALLESASGESCSKDDFVGIDQGSLDGVGPGEDRFCGNRLLNSNVIISRSKVRAVRIFTEIISVTIQTFLSLHLFFHKSNSLFCFFLLCSAIPTEGKLNERFTSDLKFNTSNLLFSLFQPQVRSNHDQALNAASNQQGFSLRYVQLPCVI